MSEFQFYDFRAVDKPLSPEQRAQVSAWSSRTTASSTRAVFTYSYRDFPQDEVSVVEQYFDAMFYTANWGSVRLILKFPASLVAASQLRPYTTEGVEVFKKSDITLVDISINNEDGGWIDDDDEDTLTSLIALRDDIIAGDYRCLYLIWLKVTMEEAMSEWGDVDPESEEPPVPVGLDSLNGALSEFVAVFGIDEDLVAVANEASPSQRSSPKLDEQAAVAHLPEGEKDDFLRRLLRNEPLLPAKLKQRLHETLGERKAAATPPPRTVEQLAQAVGTARQRRQQAKKEAREQERQAHFRKLSTREPQLWQRVNALIEEKNARSYDEAIARLKDLKQLAIFQERFAEYKTRIEQLEQRYSRLSSLKHKISVARLSEI